MKTKEELRDKYFKECTYDFHGMKKVNMTAHDMFEWVWNNFQELNQTEVRLSLAFLFAQWIGEKQYSKHQCNDRWYDDGEYIGSTSEIWGMFENDIDWHELKKANGA